MISRIELKHFKCFSDILFLLGRLTLLTGQNASGKSTLMQAIGLLHQTMREHEWSTRLMLNGETVNLGTVQDVVDQVGGRDEMEIGLLVNEIDRYRWKFFGNKSDMSMGIREARCSIGSNENWIYKADEPLHHLLPLSADSGSVANRLKKLNYLSAERVAPQEVYAHHDAEVTMTVGSKGQNAVSLLSSAKERRVIDSLVDDSTHPFLWQQVSARMAKMFPGCQLQIDELEGANGVVLGIRSSESTAYHRFTNTGFGITQLLPIVVAALNSSKDDLLLIENPEVHLHPAGQSQIGYFLAQVAAAGVQVVLETHSDHVLNGVLRAVKDEVLAGEDTAIYYFQERGQLSDDESQVLMPMVNDHAKLDCWPKGFFDQIETDFSYLAWGD